MGCFNSFGYMSHLPIREGDDVFAFICVVNKSTSPFIRVDDYIKCPYLTPVCFPIFGKYNDTGGIDEIVEDEMVKYLQEKTGFSIDRIVDVLTNNYRRVPYEGEVEDYENIKSTLFGDSLYNDQLELCLTMDHKDVYQTISDLTIKTIRKAYDLCIKNEHMLVDFYHPCLDNIESGYKGKNDYLSATYQFNDVMNINPAIDSGYWGRWSDAFSGHMLLDTFREYGKIEQTFWKEPKWKEAYIQFMSFYYACSKLFLPVTLFIWGGQEEHYRWFKKIHKSFGSILKNSEKKWLQYHDYDE